jgi:hypothetical protein
LVNLAVTVEPPGPNCTVTLPFNCDAFVGKKSVEMLPATRNVRSTGGIWPGGNVMLMNSCGGGMGPRSVRLQPDVCQIVVSGAKSVDTAWSSVFNAKYSPGRC